MLMSSNQEIVSTEEASLPIGESLQGKIQNTGYAVRNHMEIVRCGFYWICSKKPYCNSEVWILQLLIENSMCRQLLGKIHWPTVLIVTCKKEKKRKQGCAMYYMLSRNVLQTVPENTQPNIE